MRHSDRLEAVPVRVPGGDVLLPGDLTLPEGATGVVLFCHGSGSNRSSPRNLAVAGRLHEAGLATLLVDLVTTEEEGREVPVDLRILGQRVLSAASWLGSHPQTKDLAVGFFGGSTGAAVALLAAAAGWGSVGAVVSRGGRTDLAESCLARVAAPTLLLAGSRDREIVAINRRAYALLRCTPRELAVVPEAGHLFEEPGALEEVARLSAEWFLRHLGRK